MTLASTDKMSKSLNVVLAFCSKISRTRGLICRETTLLGNLVRIAMVRRAGKRKALDWKIDNPRSSTNFFSKKSK